jgi:hypothetical protein
MTGLEVVALLFAGVSAGFASALWIWREPIFNSLFPPPSPLPEGEDKKDDPAFEPAQIEIDEPIPFRSIALDTKRDGFEVTDAEGKQWFTQSGVSWFELPLYKRIREELIGSDQRITEFLLRSGVPDFGHNLTQFIRCRGGRIEFVPKPQHEPAPSGQPYR